MKELKMKIKDGWFVGFVDGDGCFAITLNKLLKSLIRNNI